MVSVCLGMVDMAVGIRVWCRLGGGAVRWRPVAGRVLARHVCVTWHMPARGLIETVGGSKVQFELKSYMYQLHVPNESSN